MAPGILLALAIIAEVAASVAARYSNGLTRAVPSLLMAFGYCISFWLLSRVLLTMPLSVAYAIWAAAGTAMIAIAGMVILGEPATPVRVAGIALIILGVAAVNLSGGAR